MTERASPSVGHGDNLPDAQTYLRALALELQMQERISALRTKHKAVRKAIEGSGVQIDDLTTLYKLRDKSEQEVEGWMRRKFGALSAYFTGLKERVRDEGLFVGYADLDQQRQQAWTHRGRMAGVGGNDGAPPAGATAEETNWFMDGFHEGNGAREEAKPVLADILAEAMEIAEAGGVVDGTSTSDVGKKVRRKRTRAAQMVADQAAEDFKNDNPPGPTADERAFAE